MSARRQDSITARSRRLILAAWGLFQTGKHSRPRVELAFITMMSDNCYSCVVLRFSQDLESAITGFEQAFEFFQ